MITDSDLYIFRIFISMFDIVDYGSALVKKHIYHPAGIYGYVINAQSEKKVIIDASHKMERVETLMCFL